ncbi:MAG: branched-chain amino acid aminotransferase [Chitinophagaceae bacterium]|jgi:branched-chain amino acid aminotransferase|nr:branched-chain amino acid aminotransferase [Chitinophagaceae bacterium]
MSNNIPIQVTKIAQSRLPQISLKNVSFGNDFTDHMLVADYANGKWIKAEILPYQPISFFPALSALHYGQAFFEGIKAYRHVSGKAFIFRPYENFKRFNRSADRMEMPAVSEDLFIEGMRKLIAIDKDWIPTEPGYSLYIRPFMFATEETLGVKVSDTYKFFIILSPSGPYYTKPAKILVEEHYTRAAPGGTGRAKNAGNYGGSLQAAKIAQQAGFDQVLWTDAFEHKWLQEVGMMNVMFIVGDTAVTPSLDEGTILEGVTRNSAIVLLKEMGLKVEERRINIDELIAAYKAGTFKEAFGLGTAAVVSPIKLLKYKQEEMSFDTDAYKIATELKKTLTGIQEGRTEDKYNWLLEV